MRSMPLSFAVVAKSTPFHSYILLRTHAKLESAVDDAVRERRNCWYRVKLRVVDRDGLNQMAVGRDERQLTKENRNE